MKLTEEKLVTTEKEVIIYGEFNSENDELFRCPKATAHEDLRNFINRNRMLIVPMRDGNYSIPFVDDETKNKAAETFFLLTGFNMKHCDIK